MEKRKFGVRSIIFLFAGLSNRIVEICLVMLAVGQAILSLCESISLVSTLINVLAKNWEQSVAAQVVPEATRIKLQALLIYATCIVGLSGVPIAVGERLPRLPDKVVVALEVVGAKPDGVTNHLKNTWFRTISWF